MRTPGGNCFFTTMNGSRAENGRESLRRKIFPPPRTAMYPACTPSVHMGGRNMLVHIWNNGEELCFVRPGTKWFEISNGGEGSFAWRAETPDWIQLSETSGEISCETRILVTVKETQEEKTGIILIRNETDNVQCEVPVLVSPGSCRL